jgi:hypothetical protein
LISILTLLLILAGIIIVGGTILSVIVVRKQRHHIDDRGSSQTTVKHKILANPILMAYILFPLVLMLLIGIYYVYFG